MAASRTSISLPLLLVLPAPSLVFHPFPSSFLSLGVMFVCLGGAVPLREQCASYSGPNVITLYKLGVTEAGGAHRLMTFYCYCSATIKLFTTPASAAEGSYLVRERKHKNSKLNTLPV